MSLTSKLRSTFRFFHVDVRGASTVEYVVLLVFVVASGIGLWKAFGQEVVRNITDTNQTMGSVQRIQ